MATNSIVLDTGYKVATSSIVLDTGYKVATNSIVLDTKSAYVAVLAIHKIKGKKHS